MTPDPAAPAGLLLAITVQQPLAACIGLDRKRVENRSAPTDHRGLLAIHAGTRWSVRGAQSDAVHAALGRVPDRADLPAGVVIALATVVDSHPDAGCCAPWGEPDAHHWTLEGITPVNQPWPVRGQLGLWTVQPPRPLLGLVAARTCGSCRTVYADELPTVGRRRRCASCAAARPPSRTARP